MLSQQYLATMPGPEFWIFFALAAGATLFCFWFFIHNLRIARLIKDTPTSKIRSAAQGFVELEGIAAKINDTMLAPLTRQPCLWYRFSIERKVQNGKSTSWRTIQSGKHPGPVVVDDGTGQCFLKIKKAKIIPNQKNTWYGNMAYPSELSVDRKDSFLQFGNYRYTEEIITEGSPLYAMGHFKTTRTVDSHSHDKAVNSIIREWKKDYKALMDKFDKNGDGTLDEKEWKLVRLAAKLEAEDLKGKLMNDPEMHTMEKQPSFPMIVAADDQRDVGKRFYWMSAFSMIGFIGIGIIALDFIKALALPVAQG